MTLYELNKYFTDNNSIYIYNALSDKTKCTLSYKGAPLVVCNLCGKTRPYTANIVNK